nr:hypothetical protein [Tanacetum cinerariifolium]
MSSDNAQSTFTYMSISSDSDGPSWGIPLMNSGEFPKMDPYEEDPEEDPSEKHELEEVDEDPEEDPNEELKPEDEDSDETEAFKEDESAVTPPPPPKHRRARISVKPQTPMAASTHALIDAFATGLPLFPLPPTNPAYDQAPLESSDAATRAPRGQYGFVDTFEAGQGLIRSPGYDAQTIARVADRAEDVGYTDRRDIRLEIDVVRGQRTAYETKLQERQNVEDLVVTQMMHIHTLEARARTDTMEDANSSCYLYFSFLAILYSLLRVMAYQAPAYQAPAPETHSVSKEDFSAYVKANDAVIRNVQTKGQNMQNQLTNLTDLMTKLVNANTASISNSSTLPSNTIANPRSDLKAITTQSGVSYD